MTTQNPTLLNYFHGQRPEEEVTPFDPAITNWIGQCAHEFNAAVINDYELIADLRFEGKEPARGQPLYIYTAGGPCSGKSTELDLFIEETTRDPRLKNAVIIDPDRYVMNDMVRTWRPLTSAGNIATYGFQKAMQRAYDLARPGSNIISNTLMNQAFNDRYSIAHGTTMTSPHIGNLLKNFDNAGYETQGILVWSDDETRIAISQHRTEVQGHFQNTESDFIEKGRAFPQRFMDYFSLTDTLRLMWKDAVTDRATLAAVFRLEGTIMEQARAYVEIHDEAAFEAFKDKYACDRGALKAQGKDLPEWSQLESAYKSGYGGVAYHHKIR